MNGMLFLFLVFLLIFISFKIFKYVNFFSNTKNIRNILLSLVIATPVIISLLYLIGQDDPYLFIGLIMGYNLNVITIIAVVDIILIRKKIFNRISYKIIYLLFSILYIYMIYNSTLSNEIDINITYIIAIFTLIYILFCLLKTKVYFPIENDIRNVKDRSRGKFIVFLLLLIVVSYLLVRVVDNISMLSVFKASSIGMFLLGMPFIIPLVFAIINLSYHEKYEKIVTLSLSSIMLNMFFIGVAALFGLDIFNINDSVIDFVSKINIYGIMIFICLLFRKKITHDLIYVVPPILIIILYLISWYLQFI